MIKLLGAALIVTASAAAGFGFARAICVQLRQMDALLGAAALGDIGQHFPDNDDRYLGADSTVLLGHVMELIREKGYRVGNVDATIIAQKPKLMPYLPLMRKKLADVMEIQEDQLNLKATTEEQLGFTGRQEGISAHCVCLLEEM